MTCTDTKDLDRDMVPIDLCRDTVPIDVRRDSVPKCPLTCTSVDGDAAHMDAASGASAVNAASPGSSPPGEARATRPVHEHCSHHRVPGEIYESKEFCLVTSDIWCV